jgi:hypothetical protein
VLPISSRSSGSSGSAIAAISSCDIWGAGFAIENWYGTSWSNFASPGVGELEGIAALSDGTVLAVSQQNYIVEN